MKKIDADLVWGYNKGTGVNVCIIDTGIDYTHPDLDANYKGGYDFVNNDADPKDDNGHGTHCAGIVAAENNTIGVVGVAPEANLYAVKVLNRLGSGYLSDVITGIEWSVANGMQVISMSLGSSTYSASLEEACDAANASGLVLVAAAGNSGGGDPATEEYSYPAAYGSVIAVGATDSGDTAPSWSNSGPYLELAAPGVNIYSTLPTYRVTLTRTYGYNYGTLSGTSMACPHVAGTAALVIASDPTLTNTEVKTLLQTTADDLGPVGWDSVYGYGLVDADEAAPGVDTIPPTIYDLTPADGAFINTGTPTISATVTDASGIDKETIAMTVDGTHVDHTYDSSTGVVSYDVPEGEPLSEVSEGSHAVTQNVSDMVGNLATASWSFTVDTIPPAISKVTATAITSSSAKITWTTDEPADSLVKYGTEPGNYTNSASDSAYVTSHDALDLTELAANTTYNYVVNSTDRSGNSNESSEYSFTTEEAPANIMHVASIDMSTTAIRLKGWYTYATATVTIVDATGTAVAGATVEGTWSGLTTDLDSGTTSTLGEVAIDSDPVKNAAGTFTFTVDDVVLSGWTYDPAANEETGDSITV